MSGHRHNPNAGTQNQGNSIGDRSSVRQSKLYRIHESGNDVKSILGTPHLCWDTHQQQGAYKGQKVYDHMRDNGRASGYAKNENTRYENDHRNKSNSNSNTRSNAYDADDNDYSYGSSSGAPPRNNARKAQNDDYDYDNNGDRSYQQPPRRQNDNYSSYPGEEYGRSGGGGGGSHHSSSRSRSNNNEVTTNDTYPLSKMGREDNQALKNYVRDQPNSSSFQSMRGEGGPERRGSGSGGGERSGSGGSMSVERVAKTYFQSGPSATSSKDRSTRPW